MKPLLTLPLLLVTTLLGHSAPSPKAYSPIPDPNNIAPTPLTAPTEARITGTPRNTKGHPCVLWDQQDIDTLKQRLARDPELQKNLADLKSAMDREIARPLDVPGKPGVPPSQKDYQTHSKNADTVSDLGTVYVLTGDERYGQYAKQLLVAYAKAYPALPHPPNWTVKGYRSALDGRITGQFLEDGFWLAKMARGADLVYNVPSWTPEERRLVREDLFEAVASTFYNPVLNADDTYINGRHNRAAMCVSAVLMAGYASDSEKLVNIALYGNNGTAEKPTGGVFGTQFSDKCILPDGLWNEGAPGYQLGIASGALFNDAETAWHHGIDLYSYRHGVLKRLLDSAIGLAYPTPELDEPLLHDSGALSLLDSRAWLSNEMGVPYMYGYLHYEDPAYLPIIRNSAKSLRMTIHAGPTSIFQDWPDEKSTPPRRMESANYFAVGYGVLRVPAAKNQNQLLMEFGPGGSHGHPSKLAIDVFALDGVLIPLPGAIFPYNSPLDAKWYWTTLANSVLTIDGQSQINGNAMWKLPKGTPHPVATQLLFGPGKTIGIQRAWSDNLYPFTVAQDRSLFLTRDYFADLYAASSDQPRQYDLSWHFLGSLETSVPLSPFTFPAPVPDGYNVLGNVRHGATESTWSATIKTSNGSPVRLFSPAAQRTEIFTGSGHFIAVRQGKGDVQPPTLIARRVEASEVLFGTAIDLSGEAISPIEGVEREGGFASGYGLLRVKTHYGTDICYTAYTPGKRMQALDFSTDALQAFVVHGASGPTALYLGGGTVLKTGDFTLLRRQTGLASLELLASGAWILSNPSPTATSLTIQHPGFGHAKAFVIDRDGQQVGPATITETKGGITLDLPAASSVELAIPAP